MKLQLQTCRICILLCILVTQGFVHAKLTVIDSLDRTLDDFVTRDATVNDDTTEGYIEYANPPDACSSMSLPNFPQNFTMKKIVLINGTTTCDLDTKVQNAKAVGYDAAVVIDPSPGTFTYQNTTFPISEVNVSVYLVLFEDGLVIRDHYLYNVRDKDHFKIKIYSNVHISWYGYLTYFAIITAAFFLGYKIGGCISWFFSGICCGSSQNEDEEQLNIEQNPLIRALLEVINEQNGSRRTEEERQAALSNLERRFPSEVFSNDHTFEVCVICRYDFEVGQSIRSLGCPHAYHTACIDKWLIESNEVCPLCKAKVNLENSCQNSYSDATESTRLLTSAHASSSTGNGIDPSHMLNYDINDPLITRLAEMLAVIRQLAEIHGSDNSLNINMSDSES